MEKKFITGYAPGAKLSNRDIARRINRSEAIRNFLKDNYGKNINVGRSQLLSARDKREISCVASNSMISLR